MKRFVSITLLLFIVFFLNYWARKKLPFAYADIADYSMLYVTNENLYVKKIEIYKDSIEMDFNGLPAKPIFTLVKNTADNGATSERGVTVYENNPLRYKPETGNVQMRANLNKTDSFLLNFSYSPAEVYRMSNNTSGVSYELTSPDLLIEPARVRPVKDWEASSWFSDDRIPLQQVQKFLRDSVHINETDSSISKIIRIAHFILKRTKNKGRIPADYLSRLHPLQQLEEIQSGRSGLWCGNYVAIFSCLATVAGIPVRTIGTGSGKGGVDMGTHMLSEVYIRENKCWAYIDLLANAFLVMNDNRYLTVIDIQRLLPYKLPDTVIKAYSFRNDSIVVVPFNHVRTVADFYFTPNTLFTFYYDRYFRMYPVDSYFKRVKNFFSMETYYALYSDNIGNIKKYEFYARLTSNILLIGVAICWIGYVMVKIMRLAGK
jgi:hypothetical protein